MPRTNPSPAVPHVVLTPGSHVARTKGCTCSAVANQYGTGVFGPGVHPSWQVAADCPIHAHLVQPARVGRSAT